MIPRLITMICARPRKPRASGDDPDSLKKLPMTVAVNPARAGMILVSAAASSGSIGKPRASGDDPRYHVGGEPADE